MSSVPLPSFGLETREPLESELARKLIDYFAASELQPGQRLPSERQMAEALGIGRASLRHALKSLSLLGVLDVRPSTGTYLRNGGSDLLPHVVEWGLLLGEKRVEEVIEARSVLEVELAGLAAQRRSAADIAQLRQLLQDMEAQGNRTDAYVDLDVRFHLAIADAAKNDVLAGVLRSLQSLLRVWATRVIEAAGETQTSLAMHAPILKAIVDADEAGARTAMGAHMERASKRLYLAIDSHR